MNLLLPARQTLIMTDSLDLVIANGGNEFYGTDEQASDHGFTSMMAMAFLPVTFLLLKASISMPVRWFPWILTEMDIRIYSSEPVLFHLIMARHPGLTYL